VDDSILEQVRTVLIDTLKLDAAAREWSGDAPLFGSVPELDSLAVINVVTAIEDRFGIHIEDDEVSGELFATLSALADFVEAKTRARR